MIPLGTKQQQQTHWPFARATRVQYRNKLNKGATYSYTVDYFALYQVHAIALYNQLLMQYASSVYERKVIIRATAPDQWTKTLLRKSGNVAQLRGIRPLRTNQDWTRLCRPQRYSRVRYPMHEEGDRLLNHYLMLCRASIVKCLRTVGYKAIRQRTLKCRLKHRETSGAPRYQNQQSKKNRFRFALFR